MLDKLLYSDLSASAVLFSVLGFLVLITVIMWQLSPEPFDLRELFTSRVNNGTGQRIDAHKVMMFGSWLVASYVVVKQASASKLEWEIFTAYLAAFVSLRLGSLYMRVKDDAAKASP